MYSRYHFIILSRSCENFGQIYYLENYWKSRNLRNFERSTLQKVGNPRNLKISGEKKMELICDVDEGTHRDLVLQGRRKNSRFPFPPTNQEEGNRAFSKFLFTPQSTQTM